MLIQEYLNTQKKNYSSTHIHIHKRAFIASCNHGCMNIHIRDYLLFRVGLETKAKLAEAKELSIKGLCSLCDGRAERREISSIDIFCYFVFIEEMSRFSSARDCLLC